MIVKDEETSLATCLESVGDLVQEIIILDTGSTDNTITIAKQAGAQVYQFPWNHDFAAARNQALKYTNGEWVLVLDADEVLTPEIAAHIKQAIESPKTLVVNLVRQEVGAMQSPYSLVSRLFRRHPQIEFNRPYHALIDDSVAKLQQQEPHWQVVSLTPVAILHYGYQPGAIAAKNKSQIAQKAMEAYLANHPGDPYVCSKLGALYLKIGEVQKGFQLLQRGLQAQNLTAPLQFELHYHLANTYANQQDPNQAALHYQQAIAQPILPQLKLGAYNNLGSLLQAAGQLPLAKQAYQKALAIDPNFTIAHYNLGMTLKAMGLFVEAIASYQKAIQLNPNYAPAYQNLGVALLKIGKLPESLSAFERAIALYTAENSPEAQRLRQGLQEMGLA